MIERKGRLTTDQKKQVRSVSIFTLFLECNEYFMNTLKEPATEVPVTGEDQQDRGLSARKKADPDSKRKEGDTEKGQAAQEREGEQTGNERMWRGKLIKQVQELLQQVFRVIKVTETLDPYSYG